MAVLGVDSKTKVGSESARKMPPTEYIGIRPELIGLSAVLRSLRLEMGLVLFHSTGGMFLGR